jgi:aspartyl protease family protein
MAINSHDILRVLSLTLFLAFLIFLYLRRNKGPNSFANVILWGVIFSVLIILYAFRFELGSLKERVLSVLVPSYSWTNQQGQLIIARSNNGHFYLDAITKNNQKITFLVDTGASDIALTKEDAQKLGFNVSKLKYTQKYSTANGVSYAAPVRIDQLTIGNKRTFHNLEAHITSGGLDISLLGMSLIGSFKDFKITRDMLILSY